MLNLLSKDFRLLFPSGKSIKKNIPSYILSVFIIALFITIEVVIFRLTLQKLTPYEGAGEGLLSIFLFVIFILVSIVGVGYANKLFFNDLDSKELAGLPISSSQIILSKLIFLLGSVFITGFMFYFPVFVAYGMLLNKPLIFYFLAAFYPLLLAIPEIGLALLFVYPFHLLSNFLKKHLIVQFVLALVIMIGLSFLYSRVLSLFIGLVTNDSMQSLFTDSSINTIKSLRNNLVPINFSLDLYLGSKAVSIVYFFAIGIGLLTLGLTLSIYGYNHFQKIVFYGSKPKKEKPLKVLSPLKSLIRKEITVLLKDSNYLFSFVGLAFAMPYLSYLVIFALNSVFSSGVMAYYVSAIPAFLPILDLLILLLFLSIIGMGADSFIKDEKDNVRLIKTIPYPASKQLLVKVLVPYIFLSALYVVAIIALLIGGVMNPLVGLFAFLIGEIYLASCYMLSLIEEVKAGVKRRDRFYSSLYSYLLPILATTIAIVFSYFNFNLYLVLTIYLVLSIGISLPIFFDLKKNLDRDFVNMEVRS